MKKTVIASLFISTMVFIGCNKNKDNKINDIDQDKVSVNENEFDVEKIPSECFVSANDKDSVFLKISDNLGTLTGKIYYNNFTKDNSYAEVMGYYSGDTLCLDFALPEGDSLMSKELWFLNKGDYLQEASGKYNQDGTYQRPKSMGYSGKKLIPADCQSVEKTLKKLQGL